jgi:hypothetical protein
LQEWLDDWDLEAPERQHRHVSHLYGLFPSNQITHRGTPDLVCGGEGRRSNCVVMSEQAGALRGRSISGPDCVMATERIYCYRKL